MATLPEAFACLLLIVVVANGLPSGSKKYYSHGRKALS
ncbi:unnamed protein product, partial [Soboliphyme baturini]|uniref:SCP domain-containing protein n=1 Tax=Soboliphyme baturini TaxID=241478 RepID=A0A183J6G3_9BILA